MRYQEIINYPRPHNPSTHPVIGHVEIEPQRLDELERRAADQTQIRVIGHDEVGNGFIEVHIACVSEAARQRFEERWKA